MDDNFGPTDQFNRLQEPVLSARFRCHAAIEEDGDVVRLEKEVNRLLSHTVEICLKT